MKTDIVVVGCGVAGLSAALSAAEKGAKVVLLERSDKKNRGGNSRYTESFFRMPNENEVSEDFEEQLAQNSMGTIDPELLKLTHQPYDKWPPILKSYGFTDPELIFSFSQDVPKTVAWLKELGIKFLEASPFLTQTTKRIAPSGGGEALVETLAEAAEKAGVQFHYETSARSLLLNDKGDVCGVRAWSNSTGNADFHAKAVVLASGGFQGNLEMMFKYVGPNSHLTRPIAPGGLYNKGEGIDMALRIGAAPSGQFDAFHAETIDPRSGKVEASIFIFGYGILVNKNGERFLDEGANLSDLIYENVARAILKQPGGVAYFIHDSKLEDIPNYEKGLHTDRSPIKAQSIKDLASKLEIDPLKLGKTIDMYNAAVQEGSYDPLNLDGKSTIGIEPPKSNWALAIDKTDLFAMPIMCANVFTFGGLKVTPKAEVLNIDGYVIPGLYAGGEIIGFYYGSYVGSTSVLKGLVFGLKAGENSVDYCRRIETA
jgi:tricarballylate dehydrogenase